MNNAFEATPSCGPSSAERLPPEQRRLWHARQREGRLADLETWVGRWRATCPPSVPLTLELCCGHGHFLASYAARFRNHACLGVDYSRQRIGRAERKARRLSLPNLAFLRAEAGELLEALPSDVRFSRVFVLFPDPWPKQRHRKNRLMSAGFVGTLARACDASAGLFFRTDSAQYHAGTVAAIQASPHWRIAPEHPWPFEHPTVFQSKCATHYSLAAIRSEAAR